MTEDFTLPGLRTGGLISVKPDTLVNVAFGALATVIVALLGLEIASIILLLGAQVIAEYERVAEWPRDVRV